MQCPTLPVDWLLVKSIFHRRWDFPHALGGLDGRHIPIRCPQGGGSLFQNSKGFHSIVLLALVDGDSKFLWVDMGAAGSTSDAQIFKHTDFRHKIEDGSIGFPDNESLGIGGPKVPFPHALANEVLLQPHYGLEGDGLQLSDQAWKNCGGECLRDPDVLL